MYFVISLTVRQPSYSPTTTHAIHKFLIFSTIVETFTEDNMIIDGHNLKISDVIDVARNRRRVEISKEAIEKIKKSRGIIEEIIREGKPVYGVNTGIGELENVRISRNEIKKLQENLIRSHACGVGEALEEEIVRGIMLLRLNSLAKGYSGVRCEVIEKIAEALNKDFYPFVPSQGSVGASGDLVPLAHIALALAGEGEAFYNGKREKAEKVLKELNIEPLKLEAKEGLALINGTQFMSSIACFAVHDLHNLLKNAQIAGVMSLEALKGTDQAFRKEIGIARPYNGQKKVLENLWMLTRGSEIIASHKECEKVQDAYTLRCMPQVFGAMYEYLDFIKNILEIEINSATDNPLVFEKEVISGGNFHGEPIAISLDLINIITTKISSFSERRIARLLDRKLSELPAFLAKKPGIQSGLMILQYVAASLVSENKSMAYPASVDSIPTSANQEDYQSMGSISARKCLQILKNAEKVVAIEYIVASQALDFFDLQPSPATKSAYEFIRKLVKNAEDDKTFYQEIEKIANSVHDGSIVNEVEKIVGKLM